MRSVLEGVGIFVSYLFVWFLWIAYTGNHPVQKAFGVGYFKSMAPTFFIAGALFMFAGAYLITLRQ